MSTAMENLNVKIDAEDKRLFVELARQMGTTPSNAVRMFVRAFNDFKGFPFDTSRPYGMTAERDGLTRRPMRRSPQERPSITGP